MNKEQWWENKMIRELTLVGIVIGAVFAIFIPIWQLKMEIALQNQKLDQIIAWSEKHDVSTTDMRKELNITFADIYLKLGSKYLPK